MADSPQRSPAPTLPPAAAPVARVVAFLNFKGGVGKTANVVNIGACLAATHQKRVLIVDLDAQCNASLWLLGKNRWRSHTEGLARSVYQLFKDKIDGTRRFRFQDAILRGVPFSDKGFGLIGSLHLLPAAVELLRIEDPLASRAALGSHRFLFDQLAAVKKDYDYILLDCPPNFYALSKNAIFFADHLAVPYIPDYLSLTGFRTLAELVEDFGKRIGGTRTALGKTRISAVVVNRYEKVGNVFQQGLLELERLTQELKHEGLIHEMTKVLEPPIRSNAQVAESPAEHLPVLLHAPKSIGATDYTALTHSFIQHYEGLQ
jgi:chromosome partitioning protein